MSCPGCPQTQGPAEPDHAPETALATPVVAGIVRGVALRALEPGDLTREEARITFHLRAHGEEISDGVFVELRRLDSPDGSPIATGRGQIPIAAPPGDYFVSVSWRLSSSAVGEGALHPVRLAPGAALSASLDVLFETGTVVVSLTAEGRRFEGHARIGVWPKDASRSGRPLARSAPGRAIRLPVGLYDIECTWDRLDATRLVKTASVRVRPDRTVALKLDLGPRPSRVRFVVRDRKEGRDLSDRTQLRITRQPHPPAGQGAQAPPASLVPRRARAELAPSDSVDPNSAAPPITRPALVLKGSAARTWSLQPGTYTVEAQYAAPPFVSERVALDRLAVKAQSAIREVLITLPLRVGRLILHSAPVSRGECTLALWRGDAERGAKRIAPNRPIELPAGTWNAALTCPTPSGNPKTRRLLGLAVLAGRDTVRDISF